VQVLLVDDDLYVMQRSGSDDHTGLIFVLTTLVTGTARGFRGGGITRGSSKAVDVVEKV